MATIRKRGDRWHVQVRRSDCQPMSKSFLNRKDAEAWARQSELDADRACLPSNRDRLKRFTLGDLVIRYRDTVTPLKRAAQVETIVINAFLRHPICARRLSEIGPQDFARYRDERLKEVKPRSLKRMLSPIQNLFEVARQDWGFPIRENPVSKLKITCENNRRERRLRDGELERIITAASKTQNPIILPVVLFALETGLRRSEILQARWSDLDRENRLLTIPRAKNGHSRTIPLSQAATMLLNELELKKAGHVKTRGSAQRGNDRIFATTANALRLAWARLLKRTGVLDLHFHDLRHEAISRFFEIGLTAPEVALISGHRDARMLFRYCHPMIKRIQMQMGLTSI